jgi:iron(II)-dependent oxidoreductase
MGELGERLGYLEWNHPKGRRATRRMATLERAVAPFFASQDWEPLYPMHLYGVYASRWPLKDQTVWTIVNRNEYDSQDRQMSLPFVEGMRYFDLYHGDELKPEREVDEAILSFTIEAHGFGMVLATRGEPDANFRTLISRMHAMTAKPLVHLLA